jgi:hypothetical protein
MRPISLRLLAAALLVLPAAARAQGTLSTQGFGYPTGQLSTRSLSTGGALGEIDPTSVTNPASILRFGGSALYFQAEPEYRTITVGGNSERTTIARYPLVAAAVPIRNDLMLGISVSSLLDRSFQTSTRGVQRIGDSTLATTNTFSSDGSVGDVRVALAWAPQRWLRLGVAGHAVTGDNRLRNHQAFDDSARFAPLTDTTTLTYVGRAYSAGVELNAEGIGSVTGSYRRGGSLSLKHGDTTLNNTKANVPDRLAFSAAYLGIRGTSIAVRAANDRWSQMRGLGTASLRVSDSWDTSVGADVLGPTLIGLPLQLRGGVRHRTLPFGVPANSFGPGTDVTESSLSFGAGTLLARGRASLDLAGIHATRDGGSYGKETAWTFSFGLTVRP